MQLQRLIRLLGAGAVNGLRVGVQTLKWDPEPLARKWAPRCEWENAVSIPQVCETMRENEEIGSGREKEKCDVEISTTEFSSECEWAVERASNLRKLNGS